MTLDLPAAPVLGDTVVIMDGWQFNVINLTVGRNGSTIEGTASDMIINVGSVLVYFTYTGTTWQLATTAGPTGYSGYSGYSGAVAGTNTQVQFNNSSTFGGASGLTYDLATSSTAADNLLLKAYSETVVTGGATGATTITPNASLGSIYTYTATGDFTLDALLNVVAGTNMTLIITQDGTGGWVMSSSMLFAGGNSTLSTAAGAVDIMKVFYSGTTYYATLFTGYV